MDVIGLIICSFSKLYSKYAVEVNHQTLLEVKKTPHFFRSIETVIIKECVTIYSCVASYNLLP